MTGLRLVSESDWEIVALEQHKREILLTLLQIGIDQFDKVLDSLPDSSRACIWMADALELAERAKESISG